MRTHGLPFLFACPHTSYPRLVTSTPLRSVSISLRGCFPCAHTGGGGGGGGTPEETGGGASSYSSRGMYGKSARFTPRKMPAIPVTWSGMEKREGEKGVDGVDGRGGDDGATVDGVDGLEEYGVDGKEVDGVDIAVGLSSNTWGVAGWLS